MPTQKGRKLRGIQEDGVSDLIELGQTKKPVMVDIEPMQIQKTKSGSRHVSVPSEELSLVLGSGLDE